MGRSKAKKDKQVNHAKGCVECGWRYEDRWEPAEKLGRCHTCAHGHPRTMSEEAQMPRDCCFLNARPVRKDERTRMRLGGPPDMPWYICDGAGEGCHRTFPFSSPASAPWIWNDGAPPTTQEQERELIRRSRYDAA